MRSAASWPAPSARVCRRAALLLGSVVATLQAPPTGRAQFAGLQPGANASSNPSPGTPANRTEPVFYQADSTTYDRDGALVTLAGHVEIWQGTRDLRADTVTYDRNTGVAAARGHVVLLDPDGRVTFADYAELSAGMKNGVMEHLTARLPDNGQLAANGARRTDARINELSRAIYSTCNACQDKPDGARLWDLRARSAVQDLDNKRIEYRDAVLDIYGVPVAWFPYFTHPDPSARRASGFLVPSLGYTKHLGAYTEVPYFWAIDGATDATLTPVLATANGPGLQTQFRHAFNNGTVTINASLANDRDQLGDDLFAKGQFVIDDEWRWGLDIQRASSETYMRDFRLSGYADVLTSQVYLEGFGQGSYARLEGRAYQGLSSDTISSRYPYVLPRYEYSFASAPDPLGGRLNLDVGAFNVARQVGTNTERASLQANWERPAVGALGDLWTLMLHTDNAAYATRQFDQSPSWGYRNSVWGAQTMPTGALQLRWPLQRDAGSWGTQVIEPIVQIMSAPNGNSYRTATNALGQSLVTGGIPNEDSLDWEFTDASLFALNRFPGVDRLEGGNRAAVALHGAWYFPDSEQIDAQIGQARRVRPDRAFPVGSGIDGTASDLVSHFNYIPGPLLSFTTQQRYSLQADRLRFADALASGGPDWLRLDLGYWYTAFDPYTYYDSVPTGLLTNTPRQEVSAGGSAHFGRWAVSVQGRRDLELGKMVSLGAGGSYEDECLIFNVQFFRRYVSIGGDGGASSLIFQVTFKTVGTLGFNGL